jgi:hypothetical protein
MGRKRSSEHNGRLVALEVFAGLSAGLAMQIVDADAFAGTWLLVAVIVVASGAVGVAARLSTKSIVTASAVLALLIKVSPTARGLKGPGRTVPWPTIIVGAGVAAVLGVSLGQLLSTTRQSLAGSWDVRPRVVERKNMSPREPGRERWTLRGEAACAGRHCRYWLERGPGVTPTVLLPDGSGSWNGERRYWVSCVDLSPPYREKDPFGYRAIEFIRFTPKPRGAVRPTRALVSFDLTGTARDEAIAKKCRSQITQVLRADNATRRK